MGRYHAAHRVHCPCEPVGDIDDNDYEGTEDATNREDPADYI